MIRRGVPSPHWPPSVGCGSGGGTGAAAPPVWAPRPRAVPAGVTVVHRQQSHSSALVVSPDQVRGRRSLTRTPTARARSRREPRTAPSRTRSRSPRTLPAPDPTPTAATTRPVAPAALALDLATARAILRDRPSDPGTLYALDAACRAPSKRRPSFAPSRSASWPPPTTTTSSWPARKTTRSSRSPRPICRRSPSPSVPAQAVGAGLDGRRPDPAGHAPPRSGRQLLRDRAAGAGHAPGRSPTARRTSIR